MTREERLAELRAELERLAALPHPTIQDAARAATIRAELTAVATHSPHSGHVSGRMIGPNFAQ